MITLPKLIKGELPKTWEHVKAAHAEVEKELKAIEKRRLTEKAGAQNIVSRVDKEARERRRGIIDIWEAVVATFVGTPEAEKHLQYTTSLVVLDAALVPDAYAHDVTTRVVDTAKAQAALEAGTEIPGLTLQKTPYIWKEFKK